MLDDNIFDGNDLIGMNLPGFTNWYRCINETVRVTHVLNRIKDIWYQAGNSSTVYEKCLNHYSLDPFACKHWSKNADCDGATEMFGIGALVLLLISLL